MQFKNIVQRKVKDNYIVTGQWQIPGFATGLGMISASRGKIMWEECTRDFKSWTKKPVELLQLYVMKN